MIAASRPFACLAALIVVFVCLIACCVPVAPAMAGGGHHGYHHNFQQHFVQPIQNVFYFVGAPLRAAAIVEHEKQSDPEWVEFQEFKRWRKWMAEKGDKPEQGDSQPPAEPQADYPAEELPPTEPAESFILQSCARCHTGANPKGGLLLDSQEALDSLSAESKLLAMQRVMAGSMPPKSNLSPEVKGDIIQEFLQEGE